jgi:outer membrane protein
MERRVLLGLAVLALMGAPFSRAIAQGEAGEPPSAVVVTEQPTGPEGVQVEAAEAVDASDEAERAEPGPSDPGESDPGLPSGAGADDPALVVPAPSMLVQDDLAPGAMIVTDGEPLAMHEAVALAIRNGLNVEVERYAPLIAEAEARAAWGAYDPTLSGDARYDVAKSPNTFAINPVDQNRDRVAGGGVGLTQLIPYLGATVSARFDSSSRATRSQLESLDDRYDSSFFMNARIPLLRNLMWNEPWTNVKLAGLQSEATELRFRQALMDTVQATVNRYWALVAARDRVRVSQKSLETARALLEQTKTQYEVGVVSQVEVVEAEAGVANREFELIQAANQYRNEQDLLIEAVFGTKLEAATSLQIVPTEDLQAYRIGSLSVDSSVARAFENRPELEVARKTIEQDEVDLRFAKSQRLPQFDADLRYGYVGVSGNGNTNLRDFDPTDGLPAPIPVDRVYGESTDDFFERDGSNNWRVQGLFSVPIPNTTGRRRVQRNEFDLRRSKTSLVRLEQGIILEVRAASRTLLSAAQRIDAAERRRLAAEEQLRAERIRLEHGESTPFEVLQREEDLVEAESQKINALQLFHAAETALERAEGTILDEHAIEVEAARAPVR